MLEREVIEAKLRSLREYLEDLREYETISLSNYQAMVKMAKFRNIIVHDYARIDPEIVVGILKNNLNDFKGFAKDILRHMDVQDVQHTSWQDSLSEAFISWYGNRMNVGGENCHGIQRWDCW